MMTTNRKRSIKGTETPRRICQPASDKPKTAAGRRKKTIIRYATANHQLSAVFLPKLFAE